MALDGVVQTTEKDEFIYHEMLTHVPILAHGAAENILIIGGGDGGILREALRHTKINNITMVEIDEAVVDMCVKYLPNHSQGAFDNSKLNLVIADGARFVAETKDKFDVIIVDSTDPIGPGEVLFQFEFYKNCKSLLNKDGIIVTQNGVAFMQPDEIKNTQKCFSKIFKDNYFYLASIPTYFGGDMAFGWGTDNAQHRHIDLDTLKARFKDSEIKTKYYNPEIHQGSFAIPQYILELISSSST